MKKEISAEKNNYIQKIKNFITQGDIECNKKALWNGELHYAAALKLAINEQDIGYQLHCLERLGNVHFKKQGYIKATALYNSALLLASTPLNRHVLIGKIKTTEKSFLEKECKLTVNQEIISSNESIKQYKDSLEFIRNKARQELTNIDEKLNPYHRTDYDHKHPEIRKMELHRAEAIKALYEEIAEDRKKCIKELLKECFKVLGDAPCLYAVIALGSLARQETTPYSDFEWAILIEEEKEEYKVYFRRLTQLLHIKILNLGETILPSMIIESLNPAYPKKPSDYWFHDTIAKRGFAFDGHMPKACKTPLGTTVINQLKDEEIDQDDPAKKKIFELIRTPIRMAELQNERWYQEYPKLPNSMFTCMWIDGDKGKDLVENYKTEMMKQLKMVSSNSATTLHQSRGLALLTQDLSEYYLNIEEQNEEGKIYNVKKEIYRLLDRVIDGLAIYYLLEESSSWKRIEELHSRKMITQEAKNNLKITMSIATELRLRTYLAYNRQTEKMQGIAILLKKLPEQESTTAEAVQKDFQALSLNMLYRFYYTALPLQTLLNDVLSKSINHKNDLPVSFLANESLLDSTNYTKGIIYKRLLQYNEAKQCLELMLQENPDHLNSMILLGGINLSLGEYEIAKNRLEKAVAFYEAKGMPDSGINLYNNLGIIYGKLGENQKQINYLWKSITIHKKLYYENNYPTFMSSLITNLHNLVLAYESLGNDQMAIAILKDLLKLKQQVSGEDHPDVANTLNNLGVLYGKLQNYQKKRDYLLEALKINKKNFDKFHPSNATILGNLSNAYGHLGDQPKKIELLKEALTIKKTFLGENHPDIANTLGNLGNAYGALKNHSEQLYYLEKASKIYQLTLRRDHQEFARVLNNLSMAYEATGQFEKAARAMEEAKHIFINKRGEEDAETQLIKENSNKLNFNLGKHYLLNNQIELAQTYYQKLGFDPKVKNPGLILHRQFFMEAYEQNNLGELIEHLKFLTIMEPQNSNLLHNLACYYHVEAKIELKQGNRESYLQKSKEAEKCFTKLLELKESSAAHTEYANFLLMNDQALRAKEHLLKTLMLKKDGKSLAYNKIEAEGVNKALQNEIKCHVEIEAKACLFAYYHLLTHHQIFGLSKIDIEKYLGEFKKEVKKENTAFAYSLLGYSYKALGEFNKAKTNFDTASKLDPKSTLCRENSSICAQLNQSMRFQ